MEIVYRRCLGCNGRDSVVFAERNRAERVSQIKTALENSSTWGELRSALPEGEWEDHFQVDCGGDDEPLDQDAFCAYDDVPSYADGDYPEWLRQVQLEWFPKDLIDKYGGQVTSTARGPVLDLPGDMAEQIADELRARGHTVCTTDQEIGLRAILPTGDVYDGPKDLVYQILENEWRLVIADREKALYTAQLGEALMSETWAEFRAKLPPGGLEEFLERYAQERDERGDPVDTFPTGDEPYSSHHEDGYPEWLGQSMFEWLPRGFLDRYREPEPFTDGCIPPEVAPEALATLRALGCRVEPSPVWIR